MNMENLESVKLFAYLQHLKHYAKHRLYYDFGRIHVFKAALYSIPGAAACEYEVPQQANLRDMDVMLACLDTSSLAAFVSWSAAVEDGSTDLEEQEIECYAHFVGHMNL